MITVDFKRLRIKPGYRILDVGCGSGRHAGAASNFKGVYTVAADIDQSEVRAAAERLRLHEQLGEVHGTWLALVAKITDLPFADRSFDLVICAEVLEHIPDQQRAVSEMERVLKPERNLVVSVPRYLPERICWALSKEYASAQNGHLRIYRKKELIRLFANAGLSAWALHWAHSLHTPFWWLKCLVGPTRQDILSVNLYHRLLVWDIMQHPWPTRLIDWLLNPLCGKSLVLYLCKKRRNHGVERIFRAGRRDGSKQI